jgi:hypothetical protein
VAAAGRPLSLFTSQQLANDLFAIVDPRRQLSSRFTIGRTIDGLLVDEANEDLCRLLSTAPYVTVSFDGWTHRSVHFIGAMVHGAAVPEGDGPALAHRQALALGVVARLADRRMPRSSRHPLWRRLQLAVDPRLRRNASRVSEGPWPRTPRPSLPRPRKVLPRAR